MKDYFAGRYHAVSQLPLRFREALEELFFFNAEQWRIQVAMLHSIERYGSPRIVPREEHLVLEIDSVPTVQTLYVLKDEGPIERLSGVIVYTRVESTFQVIFVGLDPADAYGSGGQHYLFVEMFQLLLRIARRIRGMESIEFNKGPRRLRLSVGGR